MAQYIKTEYGYKGLEESISAVTDGKMNSKMDKTNPVGTGSFSMNRKVGTVIGDRSHAEGNQTTASGSDSHAEGNNTIASGNDSHAEGGVTKASGRYSHAEGNGTTASEQASHAEGNYTTASGYYSHTEGGSTKASGRYSHAEGNYTTASGNSSHAEGSLTTASGEDSHAEGSNTTSSGSNSHAEGYNTTASGACSHVQGKYNIADTSNIYADIIGNGTSDTARSNAATVDWNGNVWFAGDAYTGSTSGTNKDDGSKKLATEEYVNRSIAAGGGSGGASDAVLYTEQSLTEEQQAQARENIDSGVAPYYVAVDRATGTWGTVSKEQLSEMRSARNTGKPVILDMKYSGNNNPRYLPLIYDGGESMGVGDVYFGYDRLGMALAIPNGGGALYKANLFMTESMFKNGDAGEALSIKSKNSDGSIEFGTKRLGAQLPELSSSVDIGLIPCVDGWGSHRFMAWKKPDEIFLGGAGGTDISLGLTSASVGQIIKVKAVDESGKPTAWEAAEMPSGGGSDGGLSADEKTLLLTLLKNAKYAENVQPAYEQLEALFNGGAIVTYTVTNNLTDLTTDNEAATITAGFPYKATLADADGNKPKSVEVVMGGVDVSGEYYADGVIDIPSVSGELVITAFAKNTYPVIYNLANTPVTCNADLYEDTGLAFGSESADGYTKSWTMVVKVKNVSAGYLWCVNGQKALSSYYENRWNSDAGDKVMTINTYICNTRVSSGITQANPDEVCIVITKEALSQKTATVHYLSWAGEYVADTVTGTYAQFFNSAYAANMMIGGQTGADFVGTIEEFVIYEGIMQEDEIKVVLGV